MGGSRYGEVAFLPIQTTNERKAFADTVTYLHDRHVFKGGVEYNETSVDQVFRGNWRGVFIFANNADLLAGRWREYRQFGGLGGLTSIEGGAASFEPEGDGALPAGPVVHPSEPDPERGRPLRDPGQPR